MYYLIRILFLLSLVFCNDGQGPLLTNMIPESDFFQSNPIGLNIQALDSDGVDEVILYYRFSRKDNYKNLPMSFDINYSANIPGFEVNSDKIQYYFIASDKFGNQSQYPINGESSPLEIPILGKKDVMFSGL